MANPYLDRRSSGNWWRATVRRLVSACAFPGRTHGHTHAPPDEAPPGGTAHDAAARLWRIRATVTDAPGSLARLCGALAGLSLNIVSLQTHPLSARTVDEFLVEAPEGVGPEEIHRAVSAAGGDAVWVEPADAHDRVDVPTRILNLATRTALDEAELPLALRQLFGRCAIRWLPERPDEDGAEEGYALAGTSMRLRLPRGGTLLLNRADPPFTPTEYARARALVDLDARLGPRVPDTRHVLELPTAGEPITVRRAEPADLAAARAMHARCGPQTLRARYHGPAEDAHRYLGHLLDPRHGQTLLVEAEDCGVVALGHLLWDDEDAEIAILVEDAWQRRGIGLELVRRLAAMAADAGLAQVYAVTRASNTGMVATLRRLGLPLDYEVDDGVLVVTAHLAEAGQDAALDAGSSTRTGPA
jgi:RimJ/RimL family protein N-acetyltransferase